MITPKTRLLENKIRTDAINNALDTLPVVDALETAWAQFALDLSPNNPAASDLMRQGAKLFIDVFQNIAKKTVVRPPANYPQLTDT